MGRVLLEFDAGSVSGVEARQVTQAANGALACSGPSLDSGQFTGKKVSPPRMPGYKPFHYRYNWNGTIDSICGACFITVASSKSFDWLSERESAHPCVPLEPVTEPQRSLWD
jgi:hypothetical protein